MMMMKHTHTERRKRKQSKRLSLSISISFIHSFSNINIYNCVLCFVCVRFIRIFSYTHWDKRTLHTEITLRKKTIEKILVGFLENLDFWDFFLIFFWFFWFKNFQIFFTHAMNGTKKNKEKTWKKVKILKKIKINLMMIIKMIFEKLD